MKRFGIFAVMILGMALGPLQVQAASQSYTNIDTVACNFSDPPPVIDALLFVNEGAFCVSPFFTNSFIFTELPYDFSNVRTFINRNIMSGAPGFRFDTVLSDGRRIPAENFQNFGSISASDSGGFIFSIGGSGFIGGSLASKSYIMINANNIVNKGQLTAGPGGLIHIRGQNVNLTNSLIVIEPLGSTGGGFFGFLSCNDFTFELSPTNFIPDVGIYDEYWGLDTFTNFNVAGFAQTLPNTVITPPSNVTNDFGFNFPQRLFLQQPSSWALVNVPSSTNVFIQAVFVETLDTNINVNVQWVNATYPGGNPSSTDFRTAVVELSSKATNLITGDPYTNTVYLIDQLGSSTNYNTLTNLSVGTLRPGPIILSRIPPCEWLFAPILSNAVVTPDMFYNPSYSNQIVTNMYAAYSSTIDNLASRLPPVQGVNITNLPGRVQIEAGNLNLDRTRIRGEGIVTLKTDNLLGTANTIMDVQNLNFDLTTARQDFPIQNLVRDSVQRFNGGLSSWSGTWTNLTEDINTNTIQINFHVTVVDATLLSSVQRVLVHDFRAKGGGNPSTVTIKDNLTVIKSFKAEAHNLVVDGSLTLSGNLRLDASSLPTARSFVNNGIILHSQAALLGTDRVPFESVINRGSMSAFSHNIRSSYFENSGDMVSGSLFFFTNFFFTNFFTPGVGVIDLQVGTAKLDGGSFQTLGDVKIAADSVKVSNFGINSDATSGGLTITATTTLEDSGKDAGNLFVVQKGFNITRLPSAPGDFLGTTFKSISRRFGVAEHIWPARDRGVSLSGFEKNLAIGRLQLDGAFFSHYVFSGTGGGNAIYVDLLELSSNVVKDLEGSITLNGINLYFADVRPMDPAAPIAVETLDGRTFGGGKMFWVKDFAGPNTSVDVLLSSGKIVKLNRALRDSLLLDSDNDGIANGQDSFPLTPQGGVALSLAVVNQPVRTAQVSFEAVPFNTYRLEYNTNLVTTNWTAIGTFSNTNAVLETRRIDQQLPSGETQRYYRIIPIQ